MVILGTVYRWFCPPTIEEMHTRLVRTEDKDEQAQDLSQLITKYGTHDWVDRLIDMAGPVLLYHIESLGDMFEILQKFVHNLGPHLSVLTFA